MNVGRDYLPPHLPLSVPSAAMCLSPSPPTASTYPSIRGAPGAVPGFQDRTASPFSQRHHKASKDDPGHVGAPWCTPGHVGRSGGTGIRSRVVFGRQNTCHFRGVHRLPPPPHPTGGPPSPPGAGLLDAVLDPVSWGSALLQPFFRGPTHQPPSLKPVSPSWPFSCTASLGIRLVARVSTAGRWGAHGLPLRCRLQDRPNPEPGPQGASPPLPGHQQPPSLPSAPSSFPPPLRLRLLTLRSFPPSPSPAQSSHSRLGTSLRRRGHLPGVVTTWGAGGQGTPLPSSG